MAANGTWEAVAWGYTQQTKSWIRVEYREEVFMSRGDWYEGRFLGSIEIQGGEISVINRFWDKIATIADPDSIKTFEDPTSTNDHLDWAWQQFKDYLSTEAQSVSELIFTTGNYEQIKAYRGTQLVLRVDSWTWSNSR